MLYRLLGVEKFKRLVLKFERLLHGKNGGRNRNYHPESMTEKGLTQYVWYLRCNTVLHVLSIASLVGYDVLLRVLGFHVWPLVLLEVLLLIYNVYCILLQRYNSIKVHRLIKARREAMEKRYERHCGMFEEKSGMFLSTMFQGARLEEDLGLLDRVESAFLEREGCTVGPLDLESLSRMERILECAGMERITGEVARKGGNAQVSIGMDLWEMEPPAWTDRALLAVRKVLDKKAREQNPLVVLRTQDAESERLFQKVFGNGSAETVLLRVRVLRRCYDTLREATKGPEEKA